MGCDCDADSVKAAAPVGRGLKQGFRRFWPDHMAFPPAAPWLGAVVNRVEAYDLVQRHATKFPGVEQGSFAAYAALVGAVLYSSGIEYAAERQQKKGGKQPEFNPYQNWFMQACKDCKSCANVFDLSERNGECFYRCGPGGGTGTLPSDQYTAETI